MQILLFLPILQIMSFSQVVQHWLLLHLLPDHSIFTLTTILLWILWVSTSLEELKAGIKVVKLIYQCSLQHDGCAPGFVACDILNHLLYISRLLVFRSLSGVCWCLCFSSLIYFLFHPHFIINQYVTVSNQGQHSGLKFRSSVTHCYGSEKWQWQFRQMQC